MVRAWLVPPLTRTFPVPNLRVAVLGDADAKGPVVLSPLLQICFGEGVSLKDSKSCKCRQEVFCSTKGIIEAQQAKSATSAGELTLID